MFVKHFLRCFNAHIQFDLIYAETDFVSFDFFCHSDSRTKVNARGHLWQPKVCIRPESNIDAPRVAKRSPLFLQQIQTAITVKKIPLKLGRSLTLLSSHNIQKS